jgi:hypothetical protein
MGGSESTLTNIEGYQVARVLANSPAHVAGLLPYFDIIIGMDGMPLDRDHKTQFQSYVTKNLEKDITLSVYNLRIRALRDVVVTPTTNWGGVGVLGCSLNWETAERCIENTWHIVEVFQGSPAAASDLVPIRDYLLGMQTAEEETITMFSDTDDFQDRLSKWKNARSAGSPNSTLLLLIFDSVNNAIKEVVVEMGNHLSLGVDVANGYLHVIPPTQGTTQLPQMKKFYGGSMQRVVAPAPMSGHAPATYAPPAATSQAPQEPPHPLPAAPPHSGHATEVQPSAPPAPAFAAAQGGHGAAPSFPPPPTAAPAPAPTNFPTPKPPVATGQPFPSPQSGSHTAFPQPLVFPSPVYPSGPHAPAPAPFPQPPAAH